MKKGIKIIADFFNFKRFKKIKIIIIIAIMILLVLMGAIGGYFVAYAQQFIDSFLDTSRVANTWNVEVDKANGEVKLAQRSCDNSVWFCDMTWRCAGLMGDGNGLLVKRTTEGAKQWKIWNNACDTPQCGIDGAQGDNLVADNTIDFSAYYPARQACKAVGGRLPSPNELQCIWQYRVTLGNNLPGDYWSSSERNNDYAYNTYVWYWGNFTPSYSGKATLYNVRCVRSW